MIVNTLAAQIIDSPEGGTVATDGREVPDYGYLIGGIVSPLMSDADGTLDREDLVFFLAYLIDTVQAPFVGWWTDEETGIVYVDGTTWTDDYNTAEQKCRDRSEIAFYDIARGQSIRPVAEAPLVNIEKEGPAWLEWSAAMYESYSADREANSGYARSAHRVAEELEIQVYEDAEVY